MRRFLDILAAPIIIISGLFVVVAATAFVLVVMCFLLLFFIPWGIAYLLGYAYLEPEKTKEGGVKYLLRFGKRLS